MWDELDELIDNVVWQRYLVNKLIQGSIPLRGQFMTCIDTMEDLHYKYQDNPEWWHSTQQVKDKYNIR